MYDTALYHKAGDDDPGYGGGRAGEAFAQVGSAWANGILGAGDPAPMPGGHEPCGLSRDLHQDRSDNTAVANIEIPV